MHFPPTSIYSSRRSPVLADNMVATSHPLAAQAGLAMLAKGGNAVDAAIATAIALTIVEPTGNGIGSDAFAIVWDGQGLHGLNASGRSPAAWRPERFAGHKTMPERGWESVTVPGAVGGWAALSKRFGKLQFADLFEPAINLAQQGFLVSPIIAALWARGGKLLKDQPGFSNYFLRDGRAPRAGERVVNREAARTLRLISGTNGEDFYRGSLAAQIAAHAKQHGAVLTADDMAAYTPDWCGTISQKFDDVELHEIPPNGQGIAACMALGMLSHTPIREFGPDDPGALHLMWEAIKLALRDAEAFVADPAAMTSVQTAQLLDPSYLAQRAALIDPLRAQSFGAGAPAHGGTVYLAAADRAGMMVSFIQSNYAGFGSGIVVPDTGIHLQNRAFGFSLSPGHPNEVGPAKRPFHTIIPGFAMTNGAPRLAFGVMGGPMQAQGHIQMLLRTELWGQDVQTAADAPRWRVVDGVNVVCETSMQPETLETLKALGHNIALEPPQPASTFGGAQLIHRLAGGGYAGGSDPRKDGCAVGM